MNTVGCPENVGGGVGVGVAVAVAVAVALAVAVGVGEGATSVTVMLKSCVATGATPLLAVTVPVKVPFVFGVPLMTPAALKVRPVGNPPAVTRKVGAGEPLAV